MKSSHMDIEITLQCSLDELNTIIKKEGYSWFAGKTLETVENQDDGSECTMSIEEETVRVFSFSKKEESKKE